MTFSENPRNTGNSMLLDIIDTERLASIVFSEPARDGEGARMRLERDARAYNLDTPEGRRAWKGAAPEGVTRTIAEDGEAWLDLVVGTVGEGVGRWLYECSGLDVRDA